MAPLKPELISFKLCPFVQRSVIVLLEKRMDFAVTYVDLSEPPGWFKRISPLGKVPVLRVGDTVVFESAVIMEYLDEIQSPSLHPSDPLRKALNRAWIEFASTLLFAQYRMAVAKTESDFEEARTELGDKLGQISEQVKGPFFNGSLFSLADAAFAPYFQRAALLRRWLAATTELPQLSTWADSLLGRRSVSDSVPRDFAELYRSHLLAHKGYATGLMQQKE